MKTLALDNIDTKFMRNVHRYKIVATLFVGVFSLASLGWMLFIASYQNIALSFVALAAAALVSSIGAWQGWYWASYGPIRMEMRKRVACFLIGISLLLFCLRFLYIYDLGFASERYETFPLKYGLLVLFFPLLLSIGLFCLSDTVHVRTSAIVDIVITTCCLVGLCWYLVTTYPAFVHLPGSVEDIWLSRLRVALLYVSGDIFLLLFVLLLRQYRLSKAASRTVLLLIIGVFSHLLTDVMGGWMNVFNKTISYTGLQITIYGWIVGLLLIGLYPLYHYAALLRDYVREDLFTPSGPLQATVNQQEHVYRHWHIQRLYVPLALILGVMSVSDAIRLHEVNNASVASLFVISSVVGMLIVTRHFFATRENEALLNEREQLFKEAEQVRELVNQLADILDLDLLRERIMDIVISQFGFTSAMLLLVDEYDVPLDVTSHIWISTASRLVSSLNWRVTGDTMLYRMVAAGKECELYWSYYAEEEMPVEVYRWQERQHVPSMTFFPIIYQGKILGSLGIARHVLSRADTLTHSIVRNYANQIAALLEHAYLYQEAHRREMFALAMVNISTRLNSAVVEPIEISQLICSEGASALHADYAIFYNRKDEGLLEPLAVAIEDAQQTGQLDDWPLLQLADYEEYGTQPYLLKVSPYSSRLPMISEHQSNDALAAANNPGSHQLALRSKLIHHHIYTAIIAPLVTGGQLNGLLMLARSVPSGSNSDPSFNESDLADAQDFVEQANVAFTNAQLYQRLSSANEQLKELDQLKDQFMITASHELRTPLTAVQGYIELIVQYDDTLPPEQRREFLHKAQMGCEELTILLHNVMDASRLEAEAALKPALINHVAIKDMLEKVMMMIEPQITRDHRQVLINVPEDISVLADPLRFHQVLMNVSTNALKYSLEGTPITFSAAPSTESEKSVVISIRDEGKGITPEDQALLFQRFYRLESDMNSPVRGSGLGLYISRRLIEAMGGKIWIESRGVPGEGSTFHILLPMA
jgi:signal transduction histidine kinase